MKRRDIIKNLSNLPFARSFLPLTSAATPADENGFPPGPLSIEPDIYESIGVDPVINCRGTFTIIGGSYFVQHEELAFGVERRLSIPVKLT